MTPARTIAHSDQPFLRFVCLCALEHGIGKPTKHTRLGCASRPAVIPLTPDRARRLHVPMQELGTVGVFVRIEQVGHLAPAHILESKRSNAT